MAAKDTNTQSHKAINTNHKANSTVIEGLDRIEIVSEKPHRRSSSGLSGSQGNHGGRKHSSASNGKRHSRSRSVQDDAGLPEGGGGGGKGGAGLSSRRKQQNEEEKEKQRRVSMAVGIGAAAIFLLAFLLIAITLRMTPQIDEMLRKENEDIFRDLQAAYDRNNTDSGGATSEDVSEDVLATTSAGPFPSSSSYIHSDNIDNSGVRSDDVENSGTEG